MTTREAVARIGLFQGLEEAHLARLASIVTRRGMRRGQDIFMEGDPGEGFYSIVAGRVKVYKSAVNGKEHILHMLGPGETFGEVAVFSGLPYPAGAQAMEDGEVLFVPRRGLKECLASDPELAMNMYGLLAARLMHLVRKVEELSLKEVPARLAAHLLLLHEAAGTGTVTLDMAKGHLAGYLGTIPETLSRILKKMQEAGLIRVRGKEVALLDTQALEALANGAERLDRV